MPSVRDDAGLLSQPRRKRLFPRLVHALRYRDCRDRSMETDVGVWNRGRRRVFSRDMRYILLFYLSTPLDHVLTVYIKQDTSAAY
jgi:hypothetical protein